MRDTAAATDSAATNSTPSTVAFRGAYRPKLANGTVNQKMTTMTNARGMASLLASNRQRTLTSS